MQVIHYQSHSHFFQFIPLRMPELHHLTRCIYSNGPIYPSLSFAVVNIAIDLSQISCRTKSSAHNNTPQLGTQKINGQLFFSLFNPWFSLVFCCLISSNSLFLCVCVYCCSKSSGSAVIVRSSGCPYIFANISMTSSVAVSKWDVAS